MMSSGVSDRETLWQVLRMNYLGGKRLSGIMSMYVNSLACVRAKMGQSECFRIEGGVRKDSIMSPWHFQWE